LESIQIFGIKSENFFCVRVCVCVCKEMCTFIQLRWIKLIQSKLQNISFSTVLVNTINQRIQKNVSTEMSSSTNVFNADNKN